MTTENSLRRRRRAIALVAAAAALGVVAFVTLAIEARSSRPDLAAGPVVPGLSESIRTAERIIVTSEDATYRIEKTPRGWAMRDRGDYPVQSGPLGRLTRGLEALRYVRRMSGDPARHARLGVDDPRQHGHGILVQVEDSRGAYLVNLILGVQTNALYVRRPDQDQVWAARGDLPPLRDVAAWLDLKPFELEAPRIARVEVTPTAGPAYVLARATPEASDFEIVSPGHPAPLSPSLVSATAEHITRLAPSDVQPVTAIQGTPSAHIRASTFDGLSIEGELTVIDNKTWIKLVARADQPGQEQAALTINNRAAGWAYALSPQEVAALAPPLSSLLPGSVATTSPSAPENQQP